MNARFFLWKKGFLFLVMTISMASLSVLFYLMGLAQSELYGSGKSLLNRTLFFNIEAEQNSLTWPFINPIYSPEDGVEYFTPIVQEEGSIHQSHANQFVSILATTPSFFKQLRLPPPPKETFCYLGAQLSKTLKKSPIFLDGIEMKPLGILPEIDINVPLMINHSIIIDMNTLSLLKTPIVTQSFLLSHKIGFHPHRVQKAVQAHIKPYLNHAEFVSSQVLSHPLILHRLQKHMRGVLSIVSVLGTLISGVTLNHIIMLRLASRRQEFGIRMALGATSSHIIQMVILEAAPIILFSIFTSLMISSTLLWILSSMNHWDLYFSFLPFIMGILLPLLTGTAFSSIPAWRLHRQWPSDLL